MIIHREYSQGSLAWLQARAGIPTASEFGALVTPKKWEVKTGEGPLTYLALKIAEAWAGGPVRGFSSFATEQGKLKETRAIPRYVLEYATPIEQVGFITDDAGRFGCSPDGLFADGTGIEIKCPEAPNHVRSLITRMVPPDYLPQIHGCMLVTGAPFWTYFSYHPRYPSLTVRVLRNDAIIASLETAVENFLDTFDAEMARMIELNGGPPPKPEPVKLSDDSDPASHLFEGLPGEHDEPGLIP